MSQKGNSALVGDTQAVMEDLPCTIVSIVGTICHKCISYLDGLS